MEEAPFLDDVSEEVTVQNRLDYTVEEFVTLRHQLFQTCDQIFILGQRIRELEKRLAKAMERHQTAFVNTIGLRIRVAYGVQRAFWHSAVRQAQLLNEIQGYHFDFFDGL